MSHLEDVLKPLQGDGDDLGVVHLQQVGEGGDAAFRDEVLDLFRLAAARGVRYRPRCFLRVPQIQHKQKDKSRYYYCRSHVPGINQLHTRCSLGCYKYKIYESQIVIITAAVKFTPTPHTSRHTQ